MATPARLAAYPPVPEIAAGELAARKTMSVTASSSNIAFSFALGRIVGDKGAQVGSGGSAKVGRGPGEPASLLGQG